MANNLADYQANAIARGYTYDFAFDAKTAPTVIPSGLRIVAHVSFDAGTDPGDDVTMFLIDSPNGPKGYLIISDIFHADPHKAAFIDSLLTTRTRDRKNQSRLYMRCGIKRESSCQHQESEHPSLE